MYTAPQLKLLAELNLRPESNLLLTKKAQINKQPPMKEFPQRSGNLETPVKNKHKNLMGQPENPHGTMSDKPGRESSEHTVHATPTSMEDPTGLENLGEPLERGLSTGTVNDNDASVHPNVKKTAPQRLEGPAENPGKQRATSFGNRYPGARNVRF